MSVPEPLEVLEGDSVRFYCKAYGKPMPTLTWVKDGQKQLGDGEMKVQTKETSRKLEVESWLKIGNSSLDDESLHYTIEAVNSVGIISHGFSLIGDLIVHLVKLNLICAVFIMI